MQSLYYTVPSAHAVMGTKFPAVFGSANLKTHSLTVLVVIVVWQIPFLPIVATYTETPLRGCNKKTIGLPMLHDVPNSGSSPTTSSAFRILGTNRSGGGITRNVGPVTSVPSNFAQKQQFQHPLQLQHLVVAGAKVVGAGAGNDQGRPHFSHFISLATICLIPNPAWHRLHLINSNELMDLLLLIPEKED